MSSDDKQSPPLHTDRERAQSFGSVAGDYDRYRPSYPDALISDLVELGPERVLDVACGTGKVAVALVACGLAVLGLEIDPAMAAVARSHGLIVEESAFETWDDEGRSFDLITCGQGWHWIDQRIGNEKAALLLNPGGTLALFWNHDEVDGELRQAFESVYRQHAPELLEVNRLHDDEPLLAALRATGKFASVTTQRYKWTATLSTDEWIGRAGTYSDHIRLPSRQRDALLAALREVIDAHGGSVPCNYRTYTIFAQTPG